MVAMRSKVTLLPWQVVYNMQQSYFTSQVSFPYKFSVLVGIFNSEDFQSLRVIKSEYLSMKHTLGQGVNWWN